MFKKITLFLLLFFLPLNISFSQINMGQKITLNYTIPPNMQNISGRINNEKVYTGGLHTVIEQLTQSLNINLNFLYYDDFEKAVQNTIIDEKNSPELIAGISYNQDFLKYFEYISFPVFNDFPVIVYDKTKISKIKAGKTIEQTLNVLKSMGNIITVNNYYLPYNDFSNESFNDIKEIFEKVLNGKNIFITTNSVLNGYMETETNKTKFQNLVIIKYKKTKIPLFIAVNKNSSFYHKKYTETKTYFNALTDAVKSYVNKTGQKTTTDLKKTF